MWYDVAVVRRLVIPASIVLAASAAPVRAQFAAAPPALDTRLRVWSPDFPQRGIIGALIATDSTHLTLETGGAARFSFPWPRVDSVQLSRGRQGGRGRRGALVGGFMGGAAHAMLAAANTDEGDVIDPAAAAGVSFVAGALAGALVGGAIGAARSHDQWEPVPLQPRLSAGAHTAPLHLRIAVVHMRFR